MRNSQKARLRALELKIAPVVTPQIVIVQPGEKPPDGLKEPVLVIRLSDKDHPPRDA